MYEHQFVTRNPISWAGVAKRSLGPSLGAGGELVGLGVPGRGKGGREGPAENLPLPGFSAGISLVSVITV